MRTPIQPVNPSIDDPIALLRACHDKIRRFSALAVRLRDHLASKGADAQAQEAAQSILRYFDIAAPLHHDDEEQDLFPALRQLAIPDVNLTIDRLDAEHADLNRLWQGMRPWLLDTVQGTAHAAPPAIDAFHERYMRHAQCEEDEIYPSCALLTPAQLEQISQAMVTRRTR